MLGLREKIVLVSGGSRGIGAAIAKGFAKAGAHVAITFLSDKRSALKCAEEITAMGSDCILIRANVSDSGDVKKTIKEVISKFGRIDVLVNNAGIWKEAKIGAISEQQWDETLEINLKGTFLFCNEIAPLMKKRRYGKIINISSTAGQRGEPFHSHYAASKGGVIAFTKSIAVELAPFNINVNSVAPGWVETDMTLGTLGDPSLRPEIDKATPRGKIAIPEDIVGTVLFLASDLSNHIVGATISINGGSVLF